MSKIKKGVIPAAGLGTRFLPATKAQPKEMLPIVDKPAIQYIVEEAAASGIEDIIIITGRGKRAIEDHFDRAVELEELLKKKGDIERLSEVRRISDMANIHYIRQKEPLGLGHAVLCAKHFIGDEPFAVLLGDDIVNSDIPCTKQLMDVYERYRSTVIGCQEVPDEEVSKYGIAKIKENNGSGVYEIDDFIEKPEIHEAPSNLASMGRYILTPEIFNELERTGPGKGGEIQLTDAIRVLGTYEKVLVYNFSGKRYDVGNNLGCLKASIEFALERQDLRDELKNYLHNLSSNLK